MIIVIDDDRTLTGKQEDEVVHLRSSFEAIAWFENHKDWASSNHPLPMNTILLLDHDLGGEDTIIIFLDWLTANRFGFKNITFWTALVHSFNPGGADNAVNKVQYLVKYARRIPLPPELKALEDD